MKPPYSIIYADPPWPYRVWSKATGNGRSAESHYRTMTWEDLAGLPVSRLAAPDCVLFCWVCLPSLPEALRVIDAWGFSYKTNAFSWVKRNKKSAGWFWGLGYWTRANVELCVLATRGNPKRESAGVHQVIDSPVRSHSSKPPEARDRIVALMGDLPRIELFAREAAEGWDATGLEMDGKDIRDFLQEHQSAGSPHQISLFDMVPAP